MPILDYSFVCLKNHVLWLNPILTTNLSSALASSVSGLAPFVDSGMLGQRGGHVFDA